MKRYVKATFEDREEQFQPSVFNIDLVDDILKNLLHELKSKYGRRYPNAKYEFNNTHFDDFYMESDIRIINNDKVIFNKKFEFQPYSDYWDETDYTQHINITIQKFIRQM